MNGIAFKSIGGMMEKVAEYLGWQDMGEGRPVLRGFRLSAPIVINEIEYHALQVFECSSVLGKETQVYGLGAGEEITKEFGDEIHAWVGANDWRGIVEIGLGYEIKFV